SRNTLLLIRGSARHGTGSSPQSPPSPGNEVNPSEAPKSNTSNLSPDSNASVTVRTADPVSVHGGAPTGDVGVPELEMQNPPAGSAGSQPTAGTPGSVKENSYQVSRLMGSASAGAAAANARA